MVAGYGSSTSSAVGAAIVQRLETWPPSARAVALRVLLGRPESTRVLLDAIDKGKAQLGELTLDQKQALAAHPDRRIAAQAKRLLARGGALPNPDRSFTCTLFWPTGSFDALTTPAVIENHFRSHYPDLVPLAPNLVDDFQHNPVGVLGTVHTKPWQAHFHWKPRAVHFQFLAQFVFRVVAPSTAANFL